MHGARVDRGTMVVSYTLRTHRIERVHLYSL